MRSTRNWGDGHTTRQRHTIEAVTYLAGFSGIRCSCEAVMTATTPEALEALWQEHGGKLLVTEAEDRVETEPFFDLGRSVKAMQVIIAIGLDCSCSPDSDITTCRNYVPDMDKED